MVSDGGPGAAATIASPSFATTITFFIRSLWLCVFLVHPFAHFSATRSPRPGTGRRKLADCRRRGCSPNRGEGVKPFPRGLGPRRPRMPRPDTRHRVFLRRPQGISPFPVPHGPTQRTVPYVCLAFPAARYRQAETADCRRRGCSPNWGEGVKPFPRGLGPRRPRMPRPDTRHRVFLRRPQGISPFPVPCGPTQRTVPCVCRVFVVCLSCLSCVCRERLQSPGV